MSNYCVYVVTEKFHQSDTIYHDGKEPITTGKYQMHKYECSACGHTPSFPEQRILNYCGACGCHIERIVGGNDYR